MTQSEDAHLALCLRYSLQFHLAKNQRLTMVTMCCCFRDSEQQPPSVESMCCVRTLWVVSCGEGKAVWRLACPWQVPTVECNCRYIALLRKALDPSDAGKGLYFSPTADLTLTQQRAAELEEQGGKEDAQLTARTEQRFFWNRHLLAPFLGEAAALYPHRACGFLLPCPCGHPVLIAAPHWDIADQRTHSPDAKASMHQGLCFSPSVSIPTGWLAQALMPQMDWSAVQTACKTEDCACDRRADKDGDRGGRPRGRYARAARAGTVCDPAHSR